MGDQFTIKYNSNLEIINGMALDQKINTLKMLPVSGDLWLTVSMVAIDLYKNHLNEPGVMSALKAAMEQDAQIKKLLTEAEPAQKAHPKPAITKMAFSWFWSIFGWLIVLLILSTFTNPNLMFHWFDPIQEPMHFISFSICVSLFLSGLAILLIQMVEPRGSTIDTSHEWVDVKSRGRVGPATERDVYEHSHGSRSWNEKIRSDRRTIQFLLFWMACFGALLIDLALGRRINLLGSGADLYLSLISLGLSGAIYIALNWIFHPTEYRDRRSAYPFSPVVDINLKAVLWISILVITFILFEAVSTWLYISNPLFDVSTQSFPKAVFVYNSILSFLVPVILVGWGVLKK